MTPMEIKMLHGKKGPLGTALIHNAVCFLVFLVQIRSHKNHTSEVEAVVPA